jgi:outer membrane lipoprotein-sorting protein
MKHPLLFLLLLLLATPACAQAVDNMPRIPTEAEKKAALMLAYELNGNSMVLYSGSIDLTMPKSIRTITIKPEPKAKP